ncbi:sodium-coupled monocarboxylate transporter 1-like [Drosophila bipectinata]|uniref:sodium-coupled monocarboxylate transporter 1-like n=1 Tax=Drosophila bipectinata TaxID=42026 RepID=UPI001C88ED87|nr:sodium-coupled monocarboxylate transporter 1-like [Drosophila bipectinata]
MDIFRFGTVDYIVFLGMLILSTATGIYYGYIKKSNKKPEEPLPSISSGEKRKHDFGSEKLNEYLMGSGSLKVFPVSMSLIASSISGVSILGTPPEVYNYGTQYWIIVVPILLEYFITAYIYLPVFWTLQVGSSNEYLELRFHSSIRSIVSLIFVLGVLMYLPFLIYLPALSLNQVSGINIYIIEAVIVVVCVFYTIVGGLKAVVHTDVWQTVIMFVSVIVIAILGTIYATGMDSIFDDLDQRGRLEFFNIDPSLYVRHTVWGLVFGESLNWISFSAVNPTVVHRYMSLPSLNKARASLAIYCVGSAGFIFVCTYLGVLLFEKYKDCDPLSAGLITNDDQMLSLFVVQSVGDIYGLPGLFIAGIFGAGLSSLSVYYNSTSLVILEDIFRGCFKMRPSERMSNIIVKSSIIVIGVLSMALALVLEKLSGILSVCTAVVSITAIAAFGIFTLGMLVPWANTLGTAIGALAGVLLSGWITLGSQFAAASGQLNSQKRPMSVDGCDGNVTLVESTWVNEEDVLALYRISYHWLILIGVTTVLVVGSLVSLVTKPTNIRTINPDLLSPVIHRFLPKKKTNIDGQG